MERKVLVYVDLEGIPRLAGSLWSRCRKNRESATFEYDDAWLNNPNKFALDPMLTLGRGSFHTPADKVIFGAIGDSAPDRWGRVLMRRFERKQAKLEDRQVRTLLEIDYLLMVNDEARQGALRFADIESGRFLGGDDITIPPLVELPRLLSAASHVIAETDSNEDLRLLLAPGSSLGGARPKASIRDNDGTLAIAKFPRHDDEINVVLWEAVSLNLAKKAGIEVPKFRVEIIAGKPVILLQRFDRSSNKRIPFISAMSMLGAKDNEVHSYLEIVDAIRKYGAKPKADIHQLWRRIIFNICISNLDDHLRNHGFLFMNSNGWQLSPAYDLNPVPRDQKPKILSTNISLDDNSASLDLAMEVTSYFELTQSQASNIITEVKEAVSTWQNEAVQHDLTKTEIKRIESAFIK